MLKTVVNISDYYNLYAAVRIELSTIHEGLSAEKLKEKAYTYIVSFGFESGKQFSEFENFIRSRAINR